MAEKKQAKTQNAKPENNIQFVGKSKRWNPETGKQELAPREAPRHIIDGMDKIKLPEAAEQAKGFYHEDAARIMALFPNDYKKPQKKG